MADTQVTILISAIDDASKVFQDVLNHSDSMANKLGKTANSLGELGQMASDFTEPLSEGLKASKNAAIDFESGMAEVRKTTGLSAAQTAELGNEIKKLSRTIPLSTKELTDIGVAAGQSGIAMKDIPNYIKDISKASVALAVDTDKAGLAFGRLANIYGMSTNEIPKLAAAINVLGDSSVASEREILNVIMRTAALSKQANLTAKDASALGASFISLGMAPSVAATAINALLSRMTTAEIQSARFQQGLAMIGMTGKELQDMTSRDGAQAIFALGQAVDKLDPQERAKAIGLMFGAEHSDNVGIFLDRMDVFKNALGSVANDQSNVNRYNEIFATQLDTTASKMQLLENSFHELAIEIGTALLPAIKAFAAFLTPIINKVTEFAAKHPNIVRLGSALAGLAISLGPLLFGLSALVKAWSLFSAGIPIVAALSDRFLGVGNPISKMLNWLAKANQRLTGIGKASDAIKPLDMMGKMPATKDCLPVCICPEICDDFEAKLKALAAKITYCIPICICPEICTEGGKLPDLNKKPATDTKTGELATALPKDAPIAPVATPALVTADANAKVEPEKAAEKQGLSLPQIAMLVAALGATVLAVQKLTDSNAGLGEKVVSAATAIGAGLAAKEVLKTKTPQEEATEVAAIQQQAAQQLGATQLEIAEKLSTKQLANAQELAKQTQANQLAEIATADKLAAGKLLAQQASNQLATQQLQAQLAAQKASAAIEVEKTRNITQQQVAATATQSAMQAATKTHTAATDVAGAQQIAATQLKADADRRQAAEEKKQAEAERIAKIRAEEEANFVPVEDSEGPTRSELRSQPAKKSGGGIGGFIKNAALVGAGAVGLGGAAMLVSKAAGGLGSAVGGLFNAAKTAAGAVGAVGSAAGKANAVASAAGKATGGAIATGIRGMQAANSVAAGLGKTTGTAIGGIIKSAGAANQAVSQSGFAVGKSLGAAIKGSQSLGAAAQSAGSGIAGAFGKAGSTIAGAAGKVGTAASSSVASTAAAIGKMQKAASVTGTAMQGVSGAIGSVLAPAKTGTAGLLSGLSKSASGLASGAKGAISSAVGAAGKLAASPASKLILPVATSIAGAAAVPTSEPVAVPVPKHTISKFTRTPAPPPEPAADLASKLASGTSSIAPFTRSARKSAAGDLATQSTAAAKNNIVPLVRSSESSGKAIASGLAKGIESSKPQAELAAAGLAQSVSSYLPRSPAEKGPLSDLDKTGFGLTQEFIRGIDGSAIQNKFEDVMNPPSKFDGVDRGAGSSASSNSAVYSPTYNLSGAPPENFIAELEKHDRKFIDWLQQTQERFNRGRY